MIKEPLSADRPTQLLPLAVPYYPSRDSTPRSSLRHTQGMPCCTQTSTHGGGSEGKQAYLDVASSTSQPKSQAVLLSWPQGVTQEAASASPGYGAADCPGVEAGRSTS